MRKQIKNYEEKIKNLEEFMMGQMNTVYIIKKRED